MHALKSLPGRIPRSRHVVAALCGRTTPSRSYSDSASSSSTTKDAEPSSDASPDTARLSLSERLLASIDKGKAPASSSDPVRLQYMPSRETSEEVTSPTSTSPVESHLSKAKRVNPSSLTAIPTFPPAMEGSTSPMDPVKTSETTKKPLKMNRRERKRKALVAKAISKLEQRGDHALLQKLKSIKELISYRPLPSTSDLGPERWAGEPWRDLNNQDAATVESVVKTVEEERASSPPHILKQTVLKVGFLQPSTETLVDVAPRSEHNPISNLSHGLERVLFNPGVHWLQDPRSRVYNFSPWLEKIPKVNDFDFDRLTGFIKSSRDEDLRALAKQENRQFAGSTSSLSGILSHIYFLLAEFKEIDYSTLSQHFRNEPATFTAGQRMPASVMLNYGEGVYAIDSHSAEYDDPDKNVLTWLGTLLENFLTKDPENFKKFMRSEASPAQTDKEPRREAYRYAKSRNFVMRSQLDCQDSRLPGTGVFDLKTRACVTVRMDILNYEENSGYLIKSQYGQLESFEKEYYDLIRSGFLKYSFQARIGNMDGVMVTYHNTERIFGFQYIPLEEMDERLFGSTPGIGQNVFDKCVELLEAVIEQAAACFPDQSVICSFETRQPGKVLEVYVQPSVWEGDKEQVPIKKLVVTLEHKLDGVDSSAYAGMKHPHNWGVTYQIGHPLLSDEEVRKDLERLEKRKKRTLILPSSVTMDDAEEYWENLSYKDNGDTDVEAAKKTFSLDAFGEPNGLIEKYRKLSREGRDYSNKLQEKEAGKPKIVLGQGVYEEDESWNATFIKKTTANVELEPQASATEKSEPKSAHEELVDLTAQPATEEVSELKS